MTVLTGFNMDVAVKLEMYTMDIIGTDVDGVVKTVLAKNRLNHLIKVLIYAVLESAGKNDLQNGKGRDRYDLKKNNIHSVMWNDVEKWRTA